MCGRFTQQRSDHELAELFEAEQLVDDPGGRFNVAPTDPVSIVVEKDERRAITAYRWGLVPFWAKDTLDRLPAHQRARRDARLEQRVPGLVRAPALPRPGRRLLRVAARPGPAPAVRLPRGSTAAPLAFAGLWSGWRDKETGEVLRTMTIVTTGANELMAPIHDRMPVVVPPDAWERWLDPALEDIARAPGAPRAGADEGLEAYPVETLVNNVRNNGPELIVPLAPPGAGRGARGRPAGPMRPACSTRSSRPRARLARGARRGPRTSPPPSRPRRAPSGSRGRGRAAVERRRIATHEPREVALGVVGRGLERRDVVHRDCRPRPAVASSVASMRMRCAPEYAALSTRHREGRRAAAAGPRSGPPNELR